MRELFYPESVAIIGASADVNKPGGRVLHNLLKHGYAGKIYPVNPFRTEVQNITSCKSLAEIAAPIELAVLAVSAEQTIPALQECAKAGVKAIAIFASGFAETGPEGREQQAIISSLARDSGMYIIGPNGQGVVNTYMGLSATFSSGWNVERLQHGRVGFATQSGAIGGMFNLLCNDVGLGLSLWASTGNEAGITIADAVNVMIDDPNTDVIGLYLEDLKDADTFFAAAVKARERGKTIVLAKGGRSPAGSRAAASHTGALAGEFALYKGAFKQYGLLMVDGLIELRNTLYTLSRYPNASGNRLGIVSTSGGIGVMMADRADHLGLHMPEPSAKTEETLRSDMPGYGTVANPLDTTAGILSDPKLIGRCVSAMIDDDGVEIVALFLGLLNRYADEVIEDISIIAKNTNKPLIVTWLAGRQGGAELLRNAGVVTLSNPLEAIDVIAQLASRKPNAKFARDEEKALPSHRQSEAKQIIASAITEGAANLSEPEAYRLLNAYGINAAPYLETQSDEEIQAMAEKLGYPVVLKATSRKILHKSDYGLVKIGIKNSEELAASVMEIWTRLKLLDPVGKLMVQKQISDGTELVVGTILDRQLGPAVMVGMGGIFVEILKDTVFFRAPVSNEEAFTMLNSLRGSKLLKGVRGRPPVDMEAMANLIAAVSNLAADLKDYITEMDLNPCIVRQEGKGVVVVDAVISLRGEG